MTETSDEIEAQVVKIVVAYADVSLKQIRPVARLWHDLRLAGDDFSEVIEELHRTLGITLRGNLEDYCLTEADVVWAGFFWWPFTQEVLPRDNRCGFSDGGSLKRRYRLTLRCQGH